MEETLEWVKINNVLWREETLEWVKSRNQKGKGTCTCHLSWLFCFISRAVWAHFGITRCAFSQLFFFFFNLTCSLKYIPRKYCIQLYLCIYICIQKKKKKWSHSLYMSRINSNLHFTNFLLFFLSPKFTVT